MPVVMNSDTFVIDNGGYFLKAGFSNQSPPRLVPNCITKAKSEKRKPFIGDQINECRDLSSLYYCLPFQKGYLTNWDTQKKIWDYLFSESCCNVDTRDTNLIFMEPLFNFNSVQEGINEMLFEDYGFKRVFRAPVPDFACYKHRITNTDPAHACLVLDIGYSFTHIVPYIHGLRIKEATLRIDVGGKLLTNHLKEIVSYRQLHVLDETYVMNACKEDCCFVSLDFHADMNETLKHKGNSITRDYILPDFHNLRRGVMKSLEKSTGRPKDENEQFVRMNNERFTVPEILFNPSDVGINQMGIGEGVAHCVNMIPENVRPWLLRNIILIGGSTKFSNMRERVEKEIREWIPDLIDVQVIHPQNPITYSWEGGAAFSEDPCFLKTCVSRKEFLERGHSVCDERFY
ncbi:actin-related protein 6 [Lepeophtheirus salmonis]|uniref:Actin-related protein 6 n=1 Tax=Lepeophtheirus salmonis TaxID=72036 RepID=A0A0K2TH30_LEPSM|nr:actin-related protein 6-like [Lepeophtheirus salmonis]